MCEVKKNDEIFTILEVANLLDVTTQAVYKRLQQDSKVMNEYLSTKSGKKSLNRKGVETLATLMTIDNPFDKKDEPKEVENIPDERALVATEAGQELLSYLRQENERLRIELEDTKKDLKYTQELREQDRRTSEQERNEAAEARKRADIMIMQALKKEEEKPRLVDRIFRRNKKEKKVATEES